MLLHIMCKTRINFILSTKGCLSCCQNTHAARTFIKHKNIGIDWVILPISGKIPLEIYCGTTDQTRHSKSLKVCNLDYGETEHIWCWRGWFSGISPGICWSTKSTNSWDGATVAQQSQNCSFCRILHIELPAGQNSFKTQDVFELLRESLLLSPWLWFQSYIAGRTQYVT